MIKLSKCPTLSQPRPLFRYCGINKQDGLSKDETAFGREPELSDADKRALIAFLKTF